TAPAAAPPVAAPPVVRGPMIQHAIPETRGRIEREVGAASGRGDRGRPQIHGGVAMVTGPSAGAAPRRELANGGAETARNRRAYD
ncbi:MAG TPA: hypothetical protein VGQ93_00320, partial [Lysobacter sp.]|nr:hypothetical protein [Lysobacter sp.]